MSEKVSENSLKVYPVSTKSFLFIFLLHYLLQIYLHYHYQLSVIKMNPCYSRLHQVCAPFRYIIHIY